MLTHELGSYGSLVGVICISTQNEGRDKGLSVALETSRVIRTHFICTTICSCERCTHF